MVKDFSGEPERALWLAVLAQAAEDAKGVNDPQKRMSIAEEYRLETEARRFLSDRDGYWREARTEACSHAGVDPEWLRENAASIRLLPGPIIPGGGCVAGGGVVAI